MAPILRRGDSDPHLPGSCRFPASNLGFPITDSNILLTQQDIQDIIAFLRLFDSTS